MYASVYAALPVVGGSMTDDNAGLPAAKLQKPAAGDVTIGTSTQAVTEPPQADAAAVLPIESSIQHATSADANGSVVDGPTGGKKRKVALYVAYIGAGYYVSLTFQCETHHCHVKQRHCWKTCLQRLTG